ncbi:hypothetical protein A2239_02295 [Candidatus Uhrbacteria bacterium RIFOXYA2_FULL_40_9]|nr:MAG: hypothetical protein A2239_02295 [Candidatus Uhrbacteria bacterium RIFOXYA2_FULL_40_9]OGL97878.1 MAG: hypothetical protein A2332_01805 [Candidatus Uhrbacteria bacterium RIFOXYB2_FULL_41_18]HBK34818.1 hypothetical protein [Candidatus Uhrbacteria bacterium]HCB55674.1 hypothetical protein [Candidatus Uhrbacteria bacterium]
MFSDFRTQEQIEKESGYPQKEIGLEDDLNKFFRIIEEGGNPVGIFDNSSPSPSWFFLFHPEAMKQPYHSVKYMP